MHMRYMNKRLYRRSCNLVLIAYFMFSDLLNFNKKNFLYLRIFEEQIVKVLENFEKHYLQGMREIFLIL